MECPVCSKVFPSKFINSHVNNCLNRNNHDKSSEGEASRPIHTNSSSSTTRPTVTEAEGEGPSLQLSVSQTSYQIENSKSNSRTPVVDKNTGIERSDTGVVSSKRKNLYLDWGSLKPMRSSQQQVGLPSTSPPTAKKKLKKDMTQVATFEKTEAPLGIIRDTFSDSSTSTLITDSSKHCTKSTGNGAFAPLAERMRPKTLEEYVGQEKAVGRETMLFSLLSSDHIPSIILWGPPGCGKTTLARIIANHCRSRGSAKFVSLSAAVCGVAEVKETINIARNDQKMFRKKTIVFLDEIHRFNKTQQDILLPHVEDGTIVLIGATTENPSFQVNSALLSRCRVVVLEKLSADSILNILKRALPYMGAQLMQAGMEILEERNPKMSVYVDSDALQLLANLVDGDARAALNGLQMAIEARVHNSSNTSHSNQMDTASNAEPTSTQLKRFVSVDDIKEGLQRSHVLYDKAGDEHYNIISALHKSMRGSDANAALYWLARMLEGGENPLYVARRLIRFACEDIGLADPQALQQAVATYQGCHLIGMPECDVILAQCVVYLARAPKSVEIYKAYGNAKSCVRQHKGPLPFVPLHLRNAPTKLMKNLGYGKEYKYNPDYEEPVDQNYFPQELLGTDFFT